MKEFEIGDVVRLNSNPNILMTVYSIDPLEWQPAIVTRETYTVIKCVWLDANGQIRYEDLDSRVLTKTHTPEDTAMTDETSVRAARDAYAAAIAEIERLKRENTALREQRNTAYGYGTDAGAPPWMR
jgi:hypothetical protein